MTYSEKFEKWRRKAQEKAEQAKEKAKELEEKYKLKDKLDEGLKAAEGAVKRGAETVGEAVNEAAQAGFEVLSATAQAAQEEINQIREDGLTDRLRENVKWASEKAEDTVRSGAQAASEAFKTGSEKVNSAANDFGAQARTYYQQAHSAYNFGQATTQAVGSMSTAVNQAAQWVRANPGKTAVIALSVTVGIRAGSYFPQLDVLLLGQKGHWFFRSAALAYGTRKLSEKYLAYLRQQQDLLTAGQLHAAERQRLEFQRQVALYVGAPLLGAFHIAAGVAILGEIFSPGHIVGFPIDLLLGQNPILETIWLFSNGLVCIHNGYEFITMAFADNAQVQKVVQDLQRLLPAAGADTANSTAA